MQHTPWLWRTSCRDDPLHYKPLPHSSLYPGTARWGEGPPPGLTPCLTMPGYMAMSIPCPHTQSWGFSVRASAYVSRAALWRPRRNLKIGWVFEMMLHVDTAMQHQAEFSVHCTHTHKILNADTVHVRKSHAMRFRRSGPIIQSLCPALLSPPPHPSLPPCTPPPSPVPPNDPPRPSSKMRTVIWRLVWRWRHCLGWVLLPSGRAPMSPGCLPPVELSDLQCTQRNTLQFYIWFPW